MEGEFFADRTRELEEIRRALRSPGRLLIHGPRRQGKTAALQEAARRFRRQGGVLLWVDLATAVRLEDVTRRSLAALPMDLLSPERWAARLPAELRSPGGLLSGRVLDSPTAVARRSPAALQAELRKIVEAVDLVAGQRGRSVAIVLDDVDELLTLEGAGGDRLLRELVLAGSQLTYLMAGSDTTRLRALTERGGILHLRTGVLPLGPIEPDVLGNWIELRLGGAGVIPKPGLGREIVRWGGPRTQDVLEVALEVFQLGWADGQATTETVPRAVRSLIDRGHDRHRLAWRSLPASQKGVLRALSRGATSLYAEETRRAHQLPPPSSTRTAVHGLLAKGIVSDEPAEGLRFDDPFFRHWVALHGMPDGRPTGELAEARRPAKAR